MEPHLNVLYLLDLDSEFVMRIPKQREEVCPLFTFRLVYLSLPARASSSPHTLDRTAQNHNWTLFCVKVALAFSLALSSIPPRFISRYLFTLSHSTFILLLHHTILTSKSVSKLRPPTQVHPRAASPYVFNVKFSSPSSPPLDHPPVT